MKAAVYYTNGGPEVFKYEDIEEPICGNDQIIIKIEAISVEGGDLINREIRPLPRVPNIVGYQCSGTITEVGASVKDRTVGQRVVAILPWGSHAEFAAANPVDTWVLPENLDSLLAAAVPVAWGTAHECLFEFGGLKAGQTVLIHASGGALGLAALQLAKRANARVFGTASTDEKLQKLAGLGLDVAINHQEEDFVEAVNRHTEGRGVDLVIDSIAGKNLARSIEALAYRGRVITVGVSGRDEERPDPVGLWRGNKSMQGVFFPSSLNTEHDRVHAIVAAILQDVADRQLKVVTDRIFPLSEAAEAHRYVLSRQSFGRVLMRP